MSASQTPEAKRCTKCGETKPISEFGRSGYRADGSVRLKAQCKPCANKRQLERKYSDPALAERIRESKRQWAKKWRSDNPDIARERGRRNMQKYLQSEQNRDRKRTYARTYGLTQAGRAANIQRANRRRARLMAVSSEAYSRTEIFARWDNLCVYCDAPAEHLDHVIALALGGADAAHNLLPACAPCNWSKGSRTLGDWVASWPTS